MQIYLEPPQGCIGLPFPRKGDTKESVFSEFSRSANCFILLRLPAAYGAHSRTDLTDYQHSPEKRKFQSMICGLIAPVLH